MSDDDTPGLKRFYTTAELEEERKDAYRNPSSQNRNNTDAAATPDARTLYERLQENKMRMEEEFQEKFKFKAPRGLEQEDIDFFEERARRRLIREIENEEEDQAELDKVYRAPRIVKVDDPLPVAPPVVVAPKQAKPAPLVKVKVVAKPKTASPSIPSSSSSSSSSKPTPSSASSSSSVSTNSSTTNAATKRKLEEEKEKEEKIVKKPTPAPAPPVANSLGSLLSYSDDDDE